MRSTRLFAFVWLAVGLVAVGLGVGGCAQSASITAERLACEYRVEPSGVGETKPRLSWRLKSRDVEERGVRMVAYRVVAAQSEHALEIGSDLLWDSGKVLENPRSSDPHSSGLATRAEWGGELLKSRDRVCWKVKVWDQDGRESGWSKAATFSLGLLEQSDWKGEWIGLEDQPAAPLTAEVREVLRRLPWIRLAGGKGAGERNERVAYFHTTLAIGGSEIESAWLAGTADMVGDLTVNGAPAGRLSRWELLKPIDVKALLKPGARNSIGVRVEHHDGFQPALTGMLVVRYAHGFEQRVAIDGSWTVATDVHGQWDTVSPDPGIEWKRVEVSGSAAWGGNRNNEHFMPRAPYLRTTFSVAEEQRVKRATLYATALGVYECRLNGAKVGTSEFAPGWTEYAKRVEHQTYDVTSMIKHGENCLGAVLGDGWYAGLMGYTGRRRFYRGPARFMGQLEVEYEDGTREVVATGTEWKASFGPITHTDNYIGSGYDARLEMPGWDTARFDASGWRSAEVGLAKSGNVRQADVTAKVRDEVKGGRVSLLVGPLTLGDPAYGIVKVLRVEYSVGGQVREVVLKESETLSLPQAGEFGDLVVTRAVFGEPTQADVSSFVIEPAMSDPVKRHEELSVQKVSEPREGRYVFDLGQNMVGWTRLKVNGKPGQRLVVRHAEMLNPDGTLYTSNLRGAIATDIFTLKGGPEVFEPPFTFHGFQYVEVTGLDAKPEPGMVTGIVAHSAMEPAGTFTCSNPLVNQLVHNIVWGQKGNYFEVPTDCPQRDERLGWTGDAQFFINTASYTFDISSFMARWLKTLCQDAQFEDGTFAHVAPKVNERGGSTAWGDAAIVCSHALYTTYGDMRVISNNYEAMKRYMAWLDTKTTGGIAKVGGFGDWVNLGDPTASELIDTAYRAELYRLMSEMAAAIDQPEDARRFAREHRSTVSAFRDRFVSDDGSLKQSGQTGYALAFTMGLIPSELREKAAAHFSAAIEKKNWHLSTGFIGTPRLLPGLALAGESAVADRLLLTEDYPSWLYQVKLGATTMWERWDGWTPERGFQDVGMNSFNHYAFGAVGDYLYRYISGIAPLSPGYQRVRIAPSLTHGLDSAAATYDSVAGKISSAWQRAADGAVFEVTVPPNVVAEIVLPAHSPDAVTESGGSLAAAQGVVVLGSSTGREAAIRMLVSSGRYRFLVHR